MKDKLEELVNEMISSGILLKQAVGEFEKAYIKQVLASNGGNKSKAARKLGIHRNTLSNKIKKYDIDF